MTVTDLSLAAAPIPAPPRWSGTAACTGDAELFFPDDEDGDAAQVAKALCAGCGVRERCLAYALANAMPAGIWGGLTTSQRDTLLRGQRTATRRGSR